MTLHPLQPPASQPSTLAAAHNALALALDQAGLSEHDTIRVAGAGALPALLWLCRRGYERVQYLRPGLPCAGMEPADALLAPHLARLGDLPALLSAAPGVREGGVVILRTGPHDPELAETLEGLMRPFGYRLEGEVDDRIHALYIARRLKAGALRRAA